MSCRRFLRTPTSRRENPTLPEQPDSALYILEQIDREVDRQITAHQRAIAAVTTRTTVLISTAVLFASLTLSAALQGLSKIAVLIAVALSFASAAAGIVSLYTKQKASGATLSQLEDALVQDPKEIALGRITNTKIEALEESKKSLGKRNTITKVGYILLGLALLVSLIDMTISTFCRG